jgi:hypothetical protein
MSDVYHGTPRIHDAPPTIPAQLTEGGPEGGESKANQHRAW